MLIVPIEYGCRHPAGTAPPLVAHLACENRLDVSSTSVRRALHGLGYRWKRPRFVLPLCDPNWRQAKRVAIKA
ncbi:winged helix-turn-helix domain-containing protein [Gemmata algarum]|uniref:winged helix-turn-helix domain-containing protein n=1 Tax=Gemmata algarum TaxID=2975278 RepID=UPI0039C9EFE3